MSLPALIVAVLATVSPVATDTTAADSSLHRFLDTLADSTDRYFGLSAEAPDTTGLDSTLAERLGKPWRGPRGHARLTAAPSYSFNRVDASVVGATLAFANRESRIGADAGYATGPDRWLGGGEASLGLRGRTTFARFRVSGGRRTAVMDRDDDSRLLDVVKAFVSGTDRRHFLRRDGFRAQAGVGSRSWFGGIEYHDWTERPLGVSTDWNLRNRPLETPGNLAAAPGRTRSVELQGALRWPWIPVTTQLTDEISSRSLGSDFEFQRLRATLASEIPVARVLSLLPQLAYGRSSGDALPQTAFYLGGSGSLRSLPGGVLGGTGFALARLDVMGADDLLRVARVPHPAMFPVQWGVFAASGAVWGHDPYGGPGTPSGAWPDRREWRSEAGLSLLYRPGIPREDAYLRLDYAWPLGGGPRTPRFGVSYSVALDLLRQF